MEELSLVYEHLMKDEFKCNRADYSFVNADFHRNALKHETEYPLYVKCALIIRLNNGAHHKDELTKAIGILEDSPTIQNADEVLFNLKSSGIIM